MLALALTLALAANPKPAPAAAKPATTDAAHEHGAHDDCKVPESGAASAKAEAGQVMLRGEKLTGATAVDMTKLLAAPADFEGKTVTVEAKIRKACEKKGCWMELTGASDKGPGVRVTFKDYGFFVPLDSAGSTAKVEGVVKVAELSEAKAKHYEAEGATVPKGKDGKYREVQLVATGVELRK